MIRPSLRSLASQWAIQPNQREGRQDCVHNETQEPWQKYCKWFWISLFCWLTNSSWAWSRLGKQSSKSLAFGCFLFPWVLQGERGEQSWLMSKRTTKARSDTWKLILDLEIIAIWRPRPSKACLLEAFEYLKTTNKHPLEGAGRWIYCFYIILCPTGGFDDLHALQMRAPANVTPCPSMSG